MSSNSKPSNIPKILLSFIFYFLSMFSLETFSVEQEVNEKSFNTPYVKKGMKKRLKGGGIAAGGTTSSVKGNVQGEVQDFSSLGTQEVDRELLDPVLRNMLSVINGTTDLNLEVRKNYEIEILKLRSGMRKVLVSHEIYIPSNSGLVAVHAVTQNAGKAGSLSENPILISHYVLERTLADFELLEEDLRRTQGYSNEERLTYMIDKVFQATADAGSETNYLRHKLFINILHELTHEVIPDSIFDRRPGDINGAEEDFVVAVTDAIVNNVDFTQVLKNIKLEDASQIKGWNYLMKGRTLNNVYPGVEDDKTVQVKERNSSYSNIDQQKTTGSEKKENLVKMSFIMNRFDDCSHSGEFKVNENQNYYVDLSGDQRNDRKVCSSLASFHKGTIKSIYLEENGSPNGSPNGRCVDIFDTDETFGTCMDISDGKIDEKSVELYKQNLNSGKIKAKVEVSFYRAERVSKYYTRKKVWTSANCAKSSLIQTVKLSDFSSLNQKACESLYNNLNGEGDIRKQVFAIKLKWGEGKGQESCLKNYGKDTVKSSTDRRSDIVRDPFSGGWETFTYYVTEHITIPSVYYLHKKPAKDPKSLMSLCKQISAAQNFNGKKFGLK